jgi:hypothetical protein
LTTDYTDSTDARTCAIVAAKVRSSTGEGSKLPILLIICAIREIRGLPCGFWVKEEGNRRLRRFAQILFAAKAIPQGKFSTAKTVILTILNKIA